MPCPPANLNDLSCDCCCRQGLVSALGDSMQSAASSRGGFVRDALTGEYPRLALLLESLLQRLKQDTSVRQCVIATSWIRLFGKRIEVPAMQ